MVTKNKKTESNTAPANACLFNNLCTVGFAESGGDSSQPRFRIVGYSGEIILDHWYWGNVAFDLSGMKFAKKVTPILAEHNRAARLGFTDKQEIAAQVVVEGPFLENDDAARLQADMKKGFPMEASLWVPPQIVEQVAKGTSVKVNGHTLDGPGAVFRKSIVKEVSMCVFGADSNTSSQAFGTDAEKIKFNLKVSENSVRKDKTMDEKLTIDKFKAEHADLHAQVFKAGRAEGEKAERDLFAEIVKACDDDSALAVKCYSEGKSATDALRMRNTKLAAELKAEKEKPATKTDTQADPAEAEFTDNQDKKPGAGDKKDPAEQTEAEQRESFKKSKKLQKEFGNDEEAYISYLKADSNGQVKIQKQG